MCAAPAGGVAVQSLHLGVVTAHCSYICALLHLLILPRCGKGFWPFFQEFCSPMDARAPGWKGGEALPFPCIVVGAWTPTQKCARCYLRWRSTLLSENSGSLLLSAWVWHVVSHWFTGSAERWIITRVQKDREPAAGFKVWEIVA